MPDIENLLQRLMEAQCEFVIVGGGGSFNQMTIKP